MNISPRNNNGQPNRSDVITRTLTKLDVLAQSCSDIAMLQEYHADNNEVFESLTQAFDYYSTRYYTLSSVLFRVIIGG